MFPQLSKEQIEELALFGAKAITALTFEDSFNEIYDLSSWLKPVADNLSMNYDLKDCRELAEIMGWDTAEIGDHKPEVKYIQSVPKNSQAIANMFAELTDARTQTEPNNLVEAHQNLLDELIKALGIVLK